MVDSTVGCTCEIQDGLALGGGESEVVHTVSGVETDQSVRRPGPIHHFIGVEKKHVGVHIICGKNTLERVCL